MLTSGPVQHGPCLMIRVESKCFLGCSTGDWGQELLCVTGWGTGKKKLTKHRIKMTAMWLNSRVFTDWLVKILHTQTWRLPFTEPSVQACTHRGCGPESCSETSPAVGVPWWSIGFLYSTYLFTRWLCKKKQRTCGNVKYVIMTDPKPTMASVVSFIKIGCRKKNKHQWDICHCRVVVWLTQCKVWWNFHTVVLNNEISEQVCLFTFLCLNQSA